MNAPTLDQLITYQELLTTAEQRAPRMEINAAFTLMAQATATELRDLKRIRLMWLAMMGPGSDPENPVRAVDFKVKMYGEVDSMEQCELIVLGTREPS